MLWELSTKNRNAYKMPWELSTQNRVLKQNTKGTVCRELKLNAKGTVYRNKELVLGYTKTLSLNSDKTLMVINRKESKDEYTILCYSS